MRRSREQRAVQPASCRLPPPLQRACAAASWPDAARECNKAVDVPVQACEQHVSWCEKRLRWGRNTGHTPHRPPVQQPALVDAEQCCLLPVNPFLTSNDVSELTVCEQTMLAEGCQHDPAGVHVTKRSVPAVYQPSKSDSLGWVQFVLQVRSESGLKAYTHIGQRFRHFRCFNAGQCPATVMLSTSP